MSGNQLLAGGVYPNTLSHTTVQGPTRKQSVEVWRSSNVKIESQSVHSCIHKNAPLKPTVTSKDISTWLITKMSNIVCILSQSIVKRQYNIPIAAILHSSMKAKFLVVLMGFFLPNTVLWTPSYHIAATLLHSNDTSTQVCRSTGGDRKSSSTIWIP